MWAQVKTTVLTTARGGHSLGVTTQDLFLCVPPGIRKENSQSFPNERSLGRDLAQDKAWLMRRMFKKSQSTENALWWWKWHREKGGFVHDSSTCQLLKHETLSSLISTVEKALLESPSPFPLHSWVPEPTTSPGCSHSQACQAFLLKLGLLYFPRLHCDYPTCLTERSELPQISSSEGSAAHRSQAADMHGTLKLLKLSITSTVKTLS